MASANLNSDKMSRHNLLEWVNLTLSCSILKIEDLCHGAAYCRLMDMLFPGSIQLKKVKFNAKLDHEFTHNLRLLQSGFARAKVDKAIPIERLMKGKFQDNFEFLQWFRKFFDKHFKQNETYDEFAARGNIQVKTLVGNRKILRKAISTPSLKVLPTVSQVSNNQKKFQNPVTSTPHSPYCPNSPSTWEALKKQVDGLQNEVSIAEKNKNFYFNKMRSIEILLQEEEQIKGKLSPKLKRIFDALYDENTFSASRTRSASVDNILL